MFINSINQTINDITTNATNKNTIYRKGDIIDTLTCKTGYTGNGYTLKCNGDDEIILEGECKETCNEMSPLFDINGNKVSTQLKGVTFANNSGGNSFYVYYRCKDPRNDKIITLETNNFNVRSGDSTYCDTMTGNLFSGPDRKVTCTADKTNKNGGKPYWQSPMGSCDLNQIKNKGYEVYLDNGITASQKSYQLRYPSSLDNVYNYVKTTNSAYFALRCEKSGWVMKKTASSCQGGLPDVLPTGSQFYRSDSDIALVGGQTGKIFNSSTFTQYSGTLTKDNLSTFVATNGSKIEANCLKYFTEVDRNDKASGDAGYGIGGHYYECVNGTWTIRGRCRKN